MHGTRDQLFGTLGKLLLALSLSTFGHFGCSDSCTRPAGRNPCREKRSYAKMVGSTREEGLGLSAPKSQRFSRFAIAMPIADPRHRAISETRPDPGRNTREQDGTRTGRDGPHLATWMGLKRCKTKHMAKLDGTPSEQGWDLDWPRIGPRRGSGWYPQRQ